MATPTSPHLFEPSINPNNHGSQVILAGAIMLSATTGMVLIGIYNSWLARSLWQLDNLVLFFSVALGIGFFAIQVIAVSNGFGRHAEILTEATKGELRRLFLAGMICFFIAQGATKIAYNLLARKTAREPKFIRIVDCFSGVILLWTLANIVVMCVTMNSASRLSKTFFVITGAISILVLVIQLGGFLWIVWSTSAKLKTKLRWSFSIGALVPACISAIIIRLVVLPQDLFIDDWTFQDVPSAILLLIELNLITINVLAPSLPVFFDRTSTGGLNFMPGQTSRSKSVGELDSKRNGYVRSSSTLRTHREDDIRLTGKGHPITTSVNRQHDEQQYRASFDSEAILVRRSIEVRDEDNEAGQAIHIVHGDHVSTLPDISNGDQWHRPRRS